MAKAKYGAKAKFIRENPGVTPEKLVELGKKKGLKVSAEYIHNIRSQDRKAGKAVKAVKAGAPRRRRTRAGPSSNLSKQERTLVQCAAEIGLTRSRELMRRLEEAAGG